MSRPRWLYVLMALVAAADAWIAHHFYGFLTGDEVEVLGEAFRVARGFEYTLWNVRNALIPDLVVAPLIRIATTHDPARLIEIATIPFIAATAVTVWLVHRLTLRWTGDAIAATAATLIFALHWIPLGFGGTTYPRVIAMMCITAAALLVDRHPLVAGALIGIAFADRYSEIVYLLPLLLVARRRALWVAGGAAVSIALVSGVHEWVRWGAPFASLRAFADLTLVQRDFASRLAHQSPLWYLETLPRWCALTLIPFFWSARRERDAWLFAIIPIALLSTIAHKEMRYLQGVIPFLAVLGGAGFALRWRSRRKTAIALLALSLAWGLLGLRFLERESRPAVDAARFLGRNHKIVTISQPWACGDRFYLGDAYPVIEVFTPPRELSAALARSDSAILYESDLAPDVLSSLASMHFERVAVFRSPRARDVVVFRKR